MEQPPVRLYPMAIAAVSSLVFVGTLGWGHAMNMLNPAPSIPAATAPAAPASAPAPRAGAPLASRSNSTPARPATKPAATPPTATPTVAPNLGGQYSWPVLAAISSPFGPRDGRMHNGIDLAANMGDAIRAARAGKVITAGEIVGYGQTVIIQHPDGTRTLYGHASRLLVKVGQAVKQGETVALVGSTGHSTGPHLHFEIIVNDKPQNPLLYLPKR